MAGGICGENNEMEKGENEMKRIEKCDCGSTTCDSYFVPEVTMDGRMGVETARMVSAADEMLDALIYFCAKVEFGLARSQKTYARYKALIESVTNRPLESIISDKYPKGFHE